MWSETYSCIRNAKNAIVGPGCRKTGLAFVEGNSAGDVILLIERSANPPSRPVAENESYGSIRLYSKIVNVLSSVVNVCSPVRRDSCCC